MLLKADRGFVVKVMGAQFYDALVTIPGCDKNMPGAGQLKSSDVCVCVCELAHLCKGNM